MSFPFGDWWFNLVDTPGHSDFSEDTYRTLTAVDAAIMVIDGAKGVESQTRKLFEVCRLRDLPILTFCNKMDREARDTFEIIDEIQHELQLDVCPASWPIGQGRDFIGCYDMLGDRLELMDRADRNRRAESVKMRGLDDPRMAELIPPDLLATLREEVEMARALLPAFDHQAMLDGNLSPIWFGSAINSFGVQELMAGIGRYGPPPETHPAEPRAVGAWEPQVTGFVFKVQANMDPKHRDRVAFLRLCSGHFQRGMKLTQVRTGKPMAVANPVLFLARDRELAEDAWAGDIIGIPNHGQLRIGDALTEGEALVFTGIPSFAPELLQVGPRRRPDEGQAPGEGAEPVRRGRRLQALQAADRLGLDRRRRRPPAVRRPRQPHRGRIRPARPLRAHPVHLRPLGLRPARADRRIRQRQQGPHGRRPRRRPGLHDPPAMGHRPRRPRLAGDPAHRHQGGHGLSDRPGGIAAPV